MVTILMPNVFCQLVRTQLIKKHKITQINIKIYVKVGVKVILKISLTVISCDVSLHYILV